MYFIGRAFCLLFSKIFLRLKVYGRENIPKEGGFILASNHFSFLDPVVLGVACPRELNFMARHDLFNTRLFSWLLTSVNAFPVKRDFADISALKGAIARLKQGKGLVLFPQGSRQASNVSFNAFVHPGIGFLAAKINAPVIPALVRGTEKALPKGAKIIRTAKISVHFGRAVTIDRNRPYQDIAVQIMENIRKLTYEPQ